MDFAANGERSGAVRTPAAARGGGIVRGFGMSRGQIVRRVVGQLGKARLGGFEMQDGVREALLFERDHAQSEVRQCAVDVFVTGGELRQRLGARRCGRVAVGAGEGFGSLGEGGDGEEERGRHATGYSLRRLSTPYGQDIYLPARLDYHLPACALTPDGSNRPCLD